MVGQQLHGDVRICLNVGSGKISLLPQLLVIIEDAIMRQSKGNPRRAYERVVITVLLLVTLGSRYGP